MTNQDRPRFGHLTQPDGTTIPLVFHPTDDPTAFQALHADSELPAQLRPGDTMQVDVIGPGQAVVFDRPPSLINTARPMSDAEHAAFRDRWLASYRTSPRPTVLPAPAQARPRGQLARRLAPGRTVAAVALALVLTAVALNITTGSGSTPSGAAGWLLIAGGFLSGLAWGLRR